MNESEDLNCFLNSAVQAIFRMLNTSLQIEKFPCLKAPPGHSCITCLLCMIFDRYASKIRSPHEKITTIELQHQISTMYNNSVFQMNEKADSMEALNALLVGIHNSFYGVYDSVHLLPIDRCPCPVHTKLTLNFVETHSCECGFYSASPCTSLFQTYIPSKITGNARELYESEALEMPYTIMHFERFCEYLAEEINEGLWTQCGCGRRYRITRSLEVVPNYFIIQVVWDELIAPKLKLLEFFVSLKFQIDIKEIYQDVRSEKFIIKGFIANIPGHYVYVGTNSAGWVVANDDKILYPSTWESLVNLLLNYHAKIVGIIYEKNSSPFPQEINEEVLKMFEKSIISSLRCQGCEEMMFDEKVCNNCGYSVENHLKPWVCSQCAAENIRRSLVCKKCSFLRFRLLPGLRKCYQCPVYSDNYSCDSCTPNTCFKCHSKIYFVQERYCRFCTRSTALQRRCDHCSKDFDFGEQLCYSCTHKYWTCMRCETRVCESRTCPKCGTASNAKLWHCRPCKVLNVQGSVCSSCGGTAGGGGFCAVCAGDTSRNQCGCGYGFTCAVCREARRVDDMQVCWRDGGRLRDGVCERCRGLVPREAAVCALCYEKGEKEGEGCIRDFVGRFRRGKRSARQCVNCGKAVNCNKVKFCWKCRGRLEDGECVYCGNREVMCRECVKYHYRCTCCKCIVFGESCTVCSTIAFPRLNEAVGSSVQEFNNDWVCFSCNSYNRYISEFCENCNETKEYSFTEQYVCEYCGGKSHTKVCRKCYWTCYCSNCEKKIFVTQKIFCGNCGSMATNRFCKDCDEFISSERILCRGCSARINLCDCGNKKHPKTLYCRYCRLKKSFLVIKCSYCKERGEINRCCYCDMECEGGKCKSCSGINSEGNGFHCRNCIGREEKCHKCKNVCWDSCKSKSLENSELILE